MPRPYMLTLDSGITIRLASLFQYHTYCGLLLGLPDRKINDQIVQTALSYAAEKLWGDEKPQLLPPRETAIVIPEPFRSNLDKSRELTEIPGIASLGSFESTTRVRDLDADLSTMKLVWFQDDFGPPVDADILAKLAAVDWKALAIDIHL